MCIWPQQVWASGTSTWQPRRSSSRTVALPTSGKSPSTRQVTNKATRTLHPPDCPSVRFRQGPPRRYAIRSPDVARPPVADQRVAEVQLRAGRRAQHQDPAVVLGRPHPALRPGHEGRPPPGLPPQPLVEPGDAAAVGQRPQLVRFLHDPPDLPHYQRPQPPPPPVLPGRPPPHLPPPPPPLPRP